MRQIKDLSLDELRLIVGSVQSALYFDEDMGGLDPDKEWSPDTLGDIAQTLNEFDLIPS